MLRRPVSQMLRVCEADLAEDSAFLPPRRSSKHLTHSNSICASESGAAMADVEQFMVVTGADEQTAKEYLQGANGDVEVAVNLFFLSSGAAEEEIPELEAPAPLTTSTGGAGPNFHWYGSHIFSRAQQFWISSSCIVEAGKSGTYAALLLLPIFLIPKLALRPSRG
jgi:hypothetical protein